MLKKTATDSLPLPFYTQPSDAKKKIFFCAKIVENVISLSTKYSAYERV